MTKAVHSRKISAKIKKFINRIHEKPDMIVVPEKKWYTKLDEKIVRSFEERSNNSLRNLITQFYAIEDRCIQCEQCVQNCPFDNILLVDSKIEFGENCCTCLRCIHHCPTEAIQIGNKTVNTARYRPVKERELFES